MQTCPTPTSVPTPAADPTTAVEVWAAIGTWVGGIATASAVGVALWISHRDWKRADSERRDQEAAQARLVTVTVPWDSNYRIVAITNHSEQLVRQPQVESMGNPRPPVRWPLAGRPSFTSRWGSNDYSAILPPHETYRVIFDYGADEIEKPVNAEEVTITFTDTSGLLWRRTGSSEPVRVIPPTPGVE